MVILIDRHIFFLDYPTTNVLISVTNELKFNSFAFAVLVRILGPINILLSCTSLRFDRLLVVDLTRPFSWATLSENCGLLLDFKRRLSSFFSSYSFLKSFSSSSVWLFGSLLRIAVSSKSKITSGICGIILKSMTGIRFSSFSSS